MCLGFEYVFRSRRGLICRRVSYWGSVRLGIRLEKESLGKLEWKQNELLYDNRQVLKTCGSRGKHRIEILKF